MDVVYILGTGSKWNDNELRYSLRSLQYIGHNRVFIVGECPDWVVNVCHVPAGDIHGEQKQRNALHKLNTAITADVSDDFILMNDDFFALQPMKPTYQYRQTLKEALQGDAGGVYLEAIENTHAMFPDGLDYSLHTPFVYNKAKLAEAIEACGDRPMLLRTVYGNLHSIGGEKMDDVKIHTARDFSLFWHVTGFDGLDSISTSDETVLSKTFQEWIAARFPEPCVYELSC
ncbi:hypothetical protein ACGYLM_01475 [Sulfitobacter sp. 1A10445]|uniref:hypothetical protein n=1 Tax=unclassified Sulfitobacter TaxID=196795 RepID=UPI003746BE92